MVRIHWLLVCVGLLAAASSAASETGWPDTAQVLVLPFDGAQGAQLRAEVIASLSKMKNVAVLDPKQTDREVKAGRLASEELTDISEGLHATFVLTGSSKSGMVSVQVLSGHSGALLGEKKAMGGKGLGAEVSRTVEEVLSGVPGVPVVAVQDAPGETGVVLSKRAKHHGMASRLHPSLKMKKKAVALALK
jgi:TolB-like protein